jgi:hypothetical protein
MIISFMFSKLTNSEFLELNFLRNYSYPFPPVGVIARSAATKQPRGLKQEAIVELYRSLSSQVKKSITY